MSKNKNSRRYSGSGPRPDRSETKRRDADARNTTWTELSAAQQLASLDSRLGKGVGAKRQRARIASRKAA
jgi:hypothetical protein